MNENRGTWTREELERGVADSAGASGIDPMAYCPALMALGSTSAGVPHSMGMLNNTIQSTRALTDDQIVARFGWRYWRNDDGTDPVGQILTGSAAVVLEVVAMERGLAIPSAYVRRWHEEIRDQSTVRAVLESQRIWIAGYIGQVAQPERPEADREVENAGAGISAEQARALMDQLRSVSGKLDTLLARG